MKKDDNLKFYSNNNGYSLLIAVCALLIFSVIGLSLLTVTANGLKKNESRESNVQAIDLADKGISYAVSDLQYQLGKLIENPIGKVTFGKKLDELLGYDSSKDVLTTTPIHKYHCGPTPQNGIKIDSSETENYTNVCIQKVEMIKTNGIIEEKDRYKRLVTFKSTGIVDGKTKETFSKVILGTDAIPDQLRYAISSNEGSVHLYGGVEIVGDIKTSEDITLHNEGYIRGVSWYKSVYPRLLPAPNSVTSKVIIPNSGSIYKLTDRQHLTTENQILSLKVNDKIYKYNKLDYSDMESSNYILSAFFNSPTLNVVKRTIDADNIDIESKINDVYNKGTYTSFTSGDIYVNGSSGNKSYFNNKKNHTTLIAEGRKCIKQNFWGCTEWGSYEYSEPANLTIEDTELTLSGQYYINGNLEIKNVELYSDAILYVNGDVDITYSKLLSKEENSTLIIFSTGKIYLGNISENSNSPSKIKGFFYSEDIVNLFGVISNVEIQGGISGKSVVLSALRGKYTTSKKTNTSEEQQMVNNGDPILGSRLKIKYDEKLIQEYTSFKRDLQEEFITSINDPEIVERY